MVLNACAKVLCKCPLAYIFTFPQSHLLLVCNPLGCHEGLAISATAIGYYVVGGFLHFERAMLLVHVLAKSVHRVSQHVNLIDGCQTTEYLALWELLCMGIPCLVSYLLTL